MPFREWRSKLAFWIFPEFKIVMGELSWQARRAYEEGFRSAESEDKWSDGWRVSRVRDDLVKAGVFPADDPVK